MKASQVKSDDKRSLLKGKFATLSLSKQLGVLLAIAVVVVVLFGSFVIYKAVHQEVLEGSQVDRHATLGLMRAAVMESLIAEDIPILEGIVYEIAALDETLVSVKIANEQGAALVTWQRPDSNPDDPATSNNMSIEFSGETFGMLSVTWDDGALHAEAVEHMIRNIKLLSGGLALMSLMIYVMLRYFTIVPMRRITVRLNEIADGDYDGSLPASSSRELTILSVAVNELSNALVEKLRAHESLVRTSTLLEHLENRSQLVLNTAAEGIVGLDQEGRVEFINKAAIEMIGCSQEQALGMPILRLIHAGTSEDVSMREEDSALMDSVKIGRVVRVDDGTFWQWDRRAFPVSYTSTPIIENGRTMGAVVVFRNEMVRHQAQLEQRLAAITFDSQEAIMVTDAYGAIMRVNKAFTEITGYAEDEAIGRNAGFQKSGRHDAEFYHALWTSLIEKGRWEGELWNCRKDGEVYPLWYVISAVRDDTKETTNYVSHAIDISKIRQTENELRESMVKAESANLAKAEFLATMSHEMRTPLNAVLGMLGLLQDENLAPRLREYVRTARDAGEGLLDLIGDVLDFSKMDAGKLELEVAPFSAIRILDNVTALLGQRAREKGLELKAVYEPEAHLFFIGDSGRLRQILLNLAVNAIKFTENGTVTLGLTVIPGNDRYVLVRFEVLDTGVVIPGARQKELFDEFTTIDNSYARQHEGAGLGLAISRRLVELMGGRIGVESSEGAGSRFWFEIKLENCEPPQTEVMETEFEAGHNSSRHARILLVEDVVANRQLAKELLVRAGHTVDAVANGAEALEALGSFPYDLVLMDISMPEMDGIEATRRIRAMTDGTATTPIVAMTAHAMKGDREAFLEAGMNDYLQKPINRNRLLEIASRYGQQDKRLVITDKSHEGPVFTDKQAYQDLSSKDASVDHATLEQLGRDTSPDLIPELVSLFIEDARARVERISTALASDDLEAIDHEVHALGSSSATYGLPTMHLLARRCEEALREGDEAHGRELATALVNSAVESFAALEAHVEHAPDMPG